jgi:hypothetical protein
MACWQSVQNRRSGRTRNRSIGISLSQCWQHPKSRSAIRCRVRAVSASARRYAATWAVFNTAVLRSFRRVISRASCSVCASYCSSNRSRIASSSSDLHAVINLSSREEGEGRGRPRARGPRYGFLNRNPTLRATVPDLFLGESSRHAERGPRGRPATVTKTIDSPPRTLRRPRQGMGAGCRPVRRRGFVRHTRLPARSRSSPLDHGLAAAEGLLGRQARMPDRPSAQRRHHRTPAHTIRGRRGRSEEPDGVRPRARGCACVLARRAPG